MATQSCALMTMIADAMARMPRPPYELLDRADRAIGDAMREVEIARRHHAMILDGVALRHVMARAMRKAAKTSRSRRRRPGGAA